MFLLAAAVVVFAVAIAFFLKGDAVRREAHANATRDVVNANRQAFELIQAERIRHDGRVAELENQLMHLAGRTWVAPPVVEDERHRPEPTPPPRLVDAGHWPSAAELESIPVEV